jgi:hypothetical protein
LKKEEKQTHQLTYNKLCYWERKLKADAVHIDHAEGTAIYTLAQGAEKHHWILIHFNSNPSDNVDSTKSAYKNIRAMMYYKFQEALMAGAVLDVKEKDWQEETEKQLCWAKGRRHKVTHQKLVEDKKELKDRVGKSPDVADALVLLLAYDVIDRLPQNEAAYDGSNGYAGGETIKIKPQSSDELYGDLDADLYD